MIGIMPRGRRIAPSSCASIDGAPSIYQEHYDTSLEVDCPHLSTVGYGKPTEDPAPTKDLLKASAPSRSQERHRDRQQVMRTARR